MFTYRSFSKDDFLIDLAQSPISHFYQYSDQDEAFEFWHKTYISVYNKHVPQISKRVKHALKLPWFTDDIKKESYFQDKLLKEVQLLKNPSYQIAKSKSSQANTDDKDRQLLIQNKFNEFRQQRLRNKVTSMLRQAHKKNFRNLILNTTKNDSKAIWKAISTVYIDKKRHLIKHPFLQVI